MRQKINLVTLGVKDLDRALNFYEKGLGWKKSTSSQGSFAVFDLGGLVFGLFPKSELAKDAGIKDSSSDGFSGIALAYNAKSEAEVDSVLKEVAVLGARICKPAEKAFWGGYSGYFQDLDGHLFEVCYNPFWQLDENDNLKIGKSI